MLRGRARRFLFVPDGVFVMNLRPPNQTSSFIGKSLHSMLLQPYERRRIDSRASAPGGGALSQRSDTVARDRVTVTNVTVTAGSGKASSNLSAQPWLLFSK